MRTTLDLPETLLKEALKITKIKTKTALITAALQNLIQAEKIKKIKKFQGQVDLDIDLTQLRKR